MVLLELALEVGVLKPKLMFGVVFVLRIGSLEFLSHMSPNKKALLVMREWKGLKRRHSPSKKEAL